MIEVRENGLRGGGGGDKQEDKWLFRIGGGGINKKTNDYAELINSTFRFAVIDEALSLLIYKTIHCDI